MRFTHRRCAKRKIPSYRRQIRDDGSDLSFVEIDGRRHYLGVYDTPESRERYHRLIAEWEASGRATQSTPKFKDLSVAEVASQFIKWAGVYYVKHDHPTKEPSNIALAFRPLLKLCAQMPAAEFGPRALKGVRQQMIDMGWSRKYINRHVDRIKRMFKWAVAEEILHPHTYEGLRALGGLRFGRSTATETRPVLPAPLELIEPVKRRVSRPVAAMIDMQFLTGARPGEIIVMRPCDIDRSDSVWVYRPTEHKTEHHGHERMIFIGPKAQEVLAPFLLRAPDAYCFSPQESEAARREVGHESRLTPDNCGNTVGSNRMVDPKWLPGEHYTSNSYRRAIDRGCEKAFPLPAALARRREVETVEQWNSRLTKDERRQIKAWRKAHHWHPHQLRHNCGTVARKEEGLEGTQVYLGHSKANVTQVAIQPSAAVR